jgi:N-formylglutamate amidohydrolase
METIFSPVVVRPAVFDTPVIIALPHSGSHYPNRLQQLSRLSALALRRSEDAYLSELLEFASALGIATVATPFARAYVDVNRSPQERDPQLVGAALGPGLSHRVIAGLGVVPRIVGAGIDIYAGPIAAAEVQMRIDAVHQPYHAALAACIAHTRARHGLALVLDFHSMPSGKFQNKPLANVVLGDCHGQSCDAVLTDRLEQLFAAQQLKVARNAPYAGGYSTAHHGAPGFDVHMIQIELDRSLYMDEARIEPHGGFAPLRAQLLRVMGALMADVPQLRRRLNWAWQQPQAAE